MNFSILFLVLSVGILIKGMDPKRPIRQPVYNGEWAYGWIPESVNNLFRYGTFKRPIKYGKVKKPKSKPRNPLVPAIPGGATHTSQAGEFVPTYPGQEQTPGGATHTSQAGEFVPAYPGQEQPQETIPFSTLYGIINRRNKSVDLLKGIDTLSQDQLNDLLKAAVMNDRVIVIEQLLSKGADASIPMDENQLATVRDFIEMKSGPEHSFDLQTVDTYDRIRKSLGIVDDEDEDDDDDEGTASTSQKS